MNRDCWLEEEANKILHQMTDEDYVKLASNPETREEILIADKKLRVIPRAEALRYYRLRMGESELEISEFWMEGDECIVTLHSLELEPIIGTPIPKAYKSKYSGWYIPKNYETVRLDSLREIIKYLELHEEDLLRK